MSDLSPELEAALTAGVQLFNDGKYLAAHEAFEDPWEANEGAADADFYKGLIQASIALYKLADGNVEGALQLYQGHRRFLGRFLPEHRGIDVQGFLASMLTFFRPLLMDPGADVSSTGWPRLERR